MSDAGIQSTRTRIWGRCSESRDANACEAIVISDAHAHTHMSYIRAVDDARRGLLAAMVAIDSARDALSGANVAWPRDFLPTRMMESIAEALRTLPLVTSINALQPDEVACTPGALEP